MSTEGPGKIPSATTSTPMETSSEPTESSSGIGKKRGMSVQELEASTNIPKKKARRPLKLSGFVNGVAVQATSHVNPPEKLSETALLWRHLSTIEKKLPFCDKTLTTAFSFDPTTTPSKTVIELAGQALFHPIALSLQDNM